MDKSVIGLLVGTFFMMTTWSCNTAELDTDEEEIEDVVEQSAISSVFGGRIDMNNLHNYSNQQIPAYIEKDNTAGNQITNEGATLGRVLFYDQSLSSDNSISCASCHKQEFGFGDDAIASVGVNGTTGRHSMRLINARFADEDQFFWDERAGSLEIQTTQPIQDHVEMGFSGNDGDENIDDLIVKLQAIPYYQELFTHAFGDENITENRMQNALAQFIRSIQSFDSRYDNGLADANNNTGANFSNYSVEENAGKRLFMGGTDFNNNGVRIGGGLGCNSCHRSPEFDIDPRSNNNGVVSAIGGGSDFNVTRSPSLRDLFNASGNSNGLFMHTGDMDIEGVLDHYNNITASQNTDRRLSRGGGQNLAMTIEEKEAVIAFLKTLSGSDVYSNEMWSDPFSE